MIRNIAYQGLAAFAKLFAGRNPDDLRVLMYHRVDEPSARPHLASCTLSATPENFRLQIEFLRKNHSIVSIADVMDAIENGSRLPSRAVLITFDDAYQCFSENAWPILREQGLPALMFVASGFPGQRNEHYWWDTIHRLVNCHDRKLLMTDEGKLPLDSELERSTVVAKLTDRFMDASASDATSGIRSLIELNSLPTVSNDVMTWQQIRELINQGLDIGAHSQTHPLLANATPSDSLHEITASMEEIEHETGVLPISFAFPGGSYDNCTVENCRQAGIKIAFTTCRGSNNLKTVDPFRLRRINVGRRATLPKLQTQLLMRESWINLLFREQAASN